MAIILWGKPTFTVTAVGGASADQSAKLTIPTPVEGSTSLTTETGEKHEALVEGGGNEAVRYDKNKYTLEFSVRVAAGRDMPFEDKSSDGRVTGTYKFVIKGEDTASPTMTLNEGSVRYEDEMSLSDGAARHYYVEALVPTPGQGETQKDMIEWTHTAAS